MTYYSSYKQKWVTGYLHAQLTMEELIDKVKLF